MNEGLPSSKILILLGISAFIYLSIKFFSGFPPSTKIVFCDVGQGDAALIRIEDRTDILIDAGPDRSVLACLGRHLPFYDREIELVIVTHPEVDHFGGLVEIFGRYRVDRLLLPSIDSSNKTYASLKQQIEKKPLVVYFPVAGDQIEISHYLLRCLWPSVEYLTQHLVFDQMRQLKGHRLGVSGQETNDFSLIFMFEDRLARADNHQFRLLLTGDAGAQILESLSHQFNLKTDILKISHHGSKHATTKKFLLLADPNLAVISVGKNNPHGHPTMEVLELLQALNIKVKRTDIEGDIVFKLSN